MKVLITGASGYVGSQTCKFLKKRSFYIFAVDRNQIKHKYFDQEIITDISDLKLIKILKEVDCVIHLAGSNLVAPSIKFPAKYYQDNVSSTILFLNACLTSGIQRFVFASSATVYGNSKKEILSEEDLCKPSNPYGWSKYMIEILLKDYADAYDFQSVSLRFFNVAGADIENELGQDKFSTHIISRLIEKSFSGEEFVLNGNNYDTKDGTCIRDYVHVEDIASGIFKAIKFKSLKERASIFNLGEGVGYSNLEIIDSIKRNTFLKPKITIGPPIKGDVKRIVANTTKVKKELGWEPKYNLDTIISTAYEWSKKNKA